MQKVTAFPNDFPASLDKMYTACAQEAPLEMGGGLQVDNRGEGGSL